MATKNLIWILHSQQSQLDSPFFLQSISGLALCGFTVWVNFIPNESISGFKAEFALLTCLIYGFYTERSAQFIIQISLYGK